MCHLPESARCEVHNSRSCSRNVRRELVVARYWRREQPPDPFRPRTRCWREVTVTESERRVISSTQPLSSGNLFLYILDQFFGIHMKIVEYYRAVRRDQDQPRRAPGSVKAHRAWTIIVCPFVSSVVTHWNLE